MQATFKYTQYFNASNISRQAIFRYKQYYNASNVPMQSIFCFIEQRSTLNKIRYTSKMVKMAQSRLFLHETNPEISFPIFPN